MYPVSNAYLEAVMARSVESLWYGNIKTKNGVDYPFDLSNIVEGSGKVTRQICNGDDIEIGTVCAAQLDLSLRMPQISRYELYASEITLFFQLRVGNAWETVPLGAFYVTDPPKRALDVITLHAYDAMQKFDLDYDQSLEEAALPYALLSYACNACGVELGNNQADIASLPNGTAAATISEEVDVYTYRDLVGHVAAYLCCFAYIGGDGKLYLQQFGMSPVRTISESWRFSYLPQDYEAYYTGLQAYFAVTEQYESVTQGAGGLVYDLGTNALTQILDEDVRASVLSNVLAGLAAIRYTPFSASVPCDPALMVGDVLTFTGNHAVSGKTSVITKQVIGINQAMTVECAGSDPNLNVQSNLEKNLFSLSRGRLREGKSYYGTTISKDHGLVVERTNGTDVEGSVTLNADELVFRDADGKPVLRYDVEKRTFVFDGILGADAVFTDSLYAEQGDIAELTVDRLSTSRRIRKYILQDTSDDNFVKIQDQYVQFIAGTLVPDIGLLTESGIPILTEDGEEIMLEDSVAPPPIQAKNRYNQPIYWQREPVGHTSDGYPTDADGVQIYAGTEQTNWPVMVYAYTELVKARFAFEEYTTAQGAQTYAPVIQLGAGDQNGNSKGFFLKEQNELILRYLTGAGEYTDIRLSDFVDAKHRRLASLDIDTTTGEVAYTVEGSEEEYGLTFTVDGDTVTYTWPDGHECVVNVV